METATLRPYDDAYLMAYSEEHVWYEVWMFFEMVRALAALSATASSHVWSTSTSVTATTTSVPPVGMPNTIAPRSGAPSSASPVKTNAYIECFMAHLRNLIEFLTNQNPRPTDVVAVDFCASGKWQPILSQRLQDAKFRVDKELAHLTTSRISGSPKRKEWDASGLAEEIGALLKKFFDTTESARLSPRVKTAIS